MTVKAAQGEITYTEQADGSVMAEIKGVEGTWVIPPDPANTDYTDYLAWLDEGNTPKHREDDAI